MMVYVSVRSVSALLLLCVSLLGLPAGAPAQSVVAPQVELPPDTFMLEPSTSPGSGR
jgi:hypothetical protein